MLIIRDRLACEKLGITRTCRPEDMEVSRNVLKPHQYLKTLSVHWTRLVPSRPLRKAE